MTSCGATLILILVLFLGSEPVLAQQSLTWGEKTTPVTKAELLEMVFQLTMHNHEKQNAMNSFSLVSFYPSSVPSSAVLFIIQAYNDAGNSPLEPNERREIRKVGDALVEQFTATCRLPLVQKRWNVSNLKGRIVIKHVRVSDVRETIAVTVDGVTSFEPVDFRRAEGQVRLAGGVWTW